MNHLLLVGLVVLLPTMAATAEEPPKPNFVLILMDDMGYGDLSAFNPHAKNVTPNLDRMAQEGMKLTSFYACPLCTPSRAQFLTGCYAKRVSMATLLWPASPIGLSGKEHTMGGLLQDQGYATLCIGKWHVGDQPEFLPTRRGFDHYFGLPYSNDMGGEWDGSPAMPPAKRRPPLPLIYDETVIETLAPHDQDLLTERYTDEALKFIREHKDRPFFLYLAHTAVHTPLHPGEKFRGKSSNGRYGDWIAEADDSTGRILDTLRALKLDRNTLVVFTSDNGPWLTQGNHGGDAGPLRGGKGSTFEGGMREPMIAWWPGHVPAGCTSDAVAANIDLLPTFVKLAGGTMPMDRRIDGADLAPLLLGQSKESPREAQYYFSGPRLEAVRSGPWKLALVHQHEFSGKPPEPDRQPFRPKLFNLDDDIGEMSDVAAKHPEIVRQLQGLVAKMDADLGAERSGPGIRPPAHVQRPQPLLLEK